jgi:hypothetical protein
MWMERWKDEDLGDGRLEDNHEEHTQRSYDSHVRMKIFAGMYVSNATYSAGQYPTSRVPGDQPVTT